ncbi:DUF21 and cbs domain containing protein [Niveomyces insectorum RCEF 264]|uniref:DUF21 and cbs domain containing protein n=1 Tax=Niveomyces insectorum RCEF 264 TaxID=1081102 RepID=A0A167TDL3_9HYPO|nr:DUF21 and cbs domain containing protein [Niveomyces insectorum RCEF 264]
MATSSAGSSNAVLKKRAVVSSFILKYPEEGGKPEVALFKRSDKVNTYQHHWAPISGSIEKDDPSPLAAAWRELREETTLTPASLELVRQGKSYTFGDPSVGREWTIYPFVYRLKSAAAASAAQSAIQTDWEHEAWAWYDPLAVEDTEAFGGVPHLAKSLRRAYFEKDLGSAPGSAGAVLARGLDRLKNDHQSGARQLAGVALGVLKDVVQALDLGTSAGSSSPSSPSNVSNAATAAPMPPSFAAVDRWWAQVRFAAWHIWKNGRESMGAAILSVLLDALASMEETLQHHHGHAGGSSHCHGALRDAVVKDLDERIAQRASAASAEPVAAALLQYLETQFLGDGDGHGALSVLTLSESSTIAQCLQHVAARSRFASLDLRVLESRPLFEGVSLGASLVQFVEDKGADSTGGAAIPVQVTLYTDASAALAAEGVDVVLLGADRIAASGAVSNKTGSLPAVLSAKQQQQQQSAGVKVVVLGETEKIATPGDPHAHVVEDNDPVQVTRAWHSGDNSTRVRSAGDRLDRALATGGDDKSNNTAVHVRVHNIFFEWVPPALVDAYVTEQGRWSVEDISRHSAALGEKEARFFQDL